MEPRQSFVRVLSATARVVATLSVLVSIATVARAGEAVLSATTAIAVEGQACGDPVVDVVALAATVGRPRLVRAGDALYVLQTAVGSKSCEVCICDVNRSRATTAADALLVLKSAVGQPVSLDCFACVLPPVDELASYPAEKEGNDTAGEGDAALENGADFDAGILGLGLRFDGVDDQMVIPHDAGQNVGIGFTVSAWIRASSFGHGRPIAQKRTPANVGGFTFETTHPPFGESDALVFVVWFEGEPVSVQTPASTISTGAWHHAVATYDGAEIRVFVDGTQRASRDETRTADESTEPVVVGRNVVAPTFAWDGLIDELRFFPRALTAFEIAALHLQGRDFEAISGQVPSLLYRAEGNASDSASAGASAGDGILKNGATFGEGQIGRALELDGVDDFVETPALTLGASTDATVTAWVRTSDANGAIFSLAHGAVEDELLLMVTAGRVGIFNHKSSGNYVARFSDTLVDDGAWAFVAGVLDGGGAASNLRVYVNGVEEGGIVNVTGTPSDIVDTTPRSVRIGWRSNQVASEAFTGRIDEVNLFDHALSSAEIRARFEAGRGPTP